MKKKMMILFCLFLTGIGYLGAQTKISGKVIDEENVLIIGANVIVKGMPQVGVSTDAAGEFILDVPEGGRIQQILIRSILDNSSLWLCAHLFE